MTKSKKDELPVTEQERLPDNDIEFGKLMPSKEAEQPADHMDRDILPNNPIDSFLNELPKLNPELMGMICLSAGAAAITAGYLLMFGIFRKK